MSSPVGGCKLLLGWFELAGQVLTGNVSTSLRFVLWARSSEFFSAGCSKFQVSSVKSWLSLALVTVDEQVSCIQPNPSVRLGQSLGLPHHVH